MNISWTEIQTARLNDLDADAAILAEAFETPEQRDRAFQKMETRLVRSLKAELRDLRENRGRPALARLQEDLCCTLMAEGFVQVMTPTIMSQGLLAKMGIGAGHPLAAQVYWLDNDRCLRPMLAPHLYFLLKGLLRLWDRPVRIFEVGSCFRKETRGSHHSSEFTMLNLVEMGLPLQARRQRLQQLAACVMAGAGIDAYRLDTAGSEVYGETIDILAGHDNLEVASAAMGPHPLDEPWRINETWVGIGFGLERLLMISENKRSLGRLGRSLTYLDGIRLNI